MGWNNVQFILFGPIINDITLHITIKPNKDTSGITLTITKQYRGRWMVLSNFKTNYENTWGSKGVSKEAKLFKEFNFSQKFQSPCLNLN